MVVSFPMLRHLSVALGKTDDRLDLAPLGPLHLATVEKTLFSMATPEFLSVLNKRPFQSLVLMGIEVRFHYLTKLMFIFRTDRWTYPENMISRMYACCSLPWTCSSVGMTCTSSPMEYRAATKKRCLGRSNECAKLVRRSRPVRACCSNCRVTPSFSVL